jgi:hypothetical protein
MPAMRIRRLWALFFPAAAALLVAPLSAGCGSACDAACQHANDLGCRQCDCKACASAPGSCDSYLNCISTSESCFEMAFCDAPDECSALVSQNCN